MSIDVLVADDEPLSLELIASLVEANSKLTLVGACKTGDAALAEIEALAPDIAFLDIHMPGLSGLDLAKRLSDGRAPHIIFVTAHEKYAVQSFELHVLDYLVKPIERARFRECTARAISVVEQARANRISSKISALLREYPQNGSQAARRNGDRIVTRTGERLDWLEIDDIVWLEASNQYLTIHTLDDDFVLSQSLSGFLAKHFDSRFIQVHRSFAINTDYARQVHKRSNGRTEVRMSNGVVIAIARSRMAVVSQILKRIRDRRVAPVTGSTAL